MDNKMPDTTEEWKEIEGLNGLFQVSTFGRVRNVKTGCMRILNNDSHGYLKITLITHSPNAAFSLVMVFVAC